MGLRCWVMPCDWLHVLNVIGGGHGSSAGPTLGIFQCSHCKTISVGSPRYGRATEPQPNLVVGGAQVTLIPWPHESVVSP